jgi:hypothetical protein
MDPAARPAPVRPALASRFVAMTATLAATTGLLALAGCASTGRAPPGPTMPRTTDGGFCVAGQAAVNGSKVVAVNTVYTDYAAFVESKPAPRPLATRQ